MRCRSRWWPAPAPCASLERFGFAYRLPLARPEYFPTKILNIFFVEGDARDRGFKGVGAVLRRFAHLEAIHRDGEAALHLIDDLKDDIVIRKRSRRPVARIRPDGNNFIRFITREIIQHAIDIVLITRLEIRTKIIGTGFAVEGSVLEIQGQRVQFTARIRKGRVAGTSISTMQRVSRMLKIRFFIMFPHFLPRSFLRDVAS